MAEGNADSVEVNADILNAKADELDNVAFPTELPWQPTGADGTANIAGRAAMVLRLTGYDVLNCIAAAEQERVRLVETLRAAARAYTQAQDASTAAIVNGTSSIEPVPVDVSKVPEPKPIFRVSGWSHEPPIYNHSDVEINAEQLEKETPQSLKDFIEDWGKFIPLIADQAKAFIRPRGWHSPAAEACAAAIDAHRVWLEGELKQAVEKLQRQAQALLGAHDDAKKDHPTSAEAKNLNNKIADSSGEERRDYMDQYQQLQQRSDEKMSAYAGGAQVRAMHIESPPSGSPNIPPFPRKAHGGGGGAPGGGGGAPGGGGTPPGGPEQPGAGPADGQPQPQAGGQPGGGEQKGGGQPGGGSPSGGSPAGGGEQKGGAPGGGMPSLPDPSTGLPKIDEPALHKASAGGGSGGGGGGGGLPPMPLQPNVGSVSVGPGPASGGAPGGAAPAGAPGGMGAMGGGGAPMGGGGHGQGGGGKEKRRTPGLSPDEDLYTEDRDWTEGYIGKPQRKPGSPSKDRREE